MVSCSDPTREFGEFSQIYHEIEIFLHFCCAFEEISKHQDLYRVSEYAGNNLLMQAVCVLVCRFP